MNTVSADREIWPELLEKVAEQEHEQWAGWMRYLFTKCGDGEEVVIPKPLVERWRRQMSTPYNALPEQERESDRKEAREALSLIMPLLAAGPTKR